MPLAGWSSDDRLPSLHRGPAVPPSPGCFLSLPLPLLSSHLSASLCFQFLPSSLFSSSFFSFPPFYLFLREFYFSVILLYFLCLTHVIAQLCLTLCNPIAGSSVQGISQARLLECVATSSFRESSRFKDLNVSCVSCIGRRILYHWYHQGSPFYIYLF